MPPEVVQTRENHVRRDPSFHYFLVLPLLLIVLWSLIHVVRHPGTESIVLTLLAMCSLLTALKTRQYAAKVQDRVIRLEERLRLAALLPVAEQANCSQLTEAQFVALRFASDAEFPSLAQRAAREKLTSRQIKEAIQNWRADYFRV